jgi:hypothetical protein
MPASKESAEDSDEQEGSTLPLPALATLNDNPAEEPPLLTLSSLSSDAPLPLPPPLRMPPHPATALQMPDTLQPPQCQSVLRLACLCIPDLLLPLKTLPVPARCSRHSTAGIPPNPRLSATQYLQEGCPAPICVATYSETHSCLQSAAPPSAPTSCKPTVTVFLRPLSPCDLVRAESQLPARATPFCPSLLRHKHHSANWAPNICCSNHIGHCVVRTFHLPCSVFSRSLHSVFHMLVASMVLFPCFKWVAIRRAQIAVGGF